MAALSRPTRAALDLLGTRIAVARRERRWTTAELAERAGISLPTLRRIERGDPGVAIGTAFEVAVLVGVQLWGVDRRELARHVAIGRERLALLPQRVRESARDVDDNAPHR